MRFEVFASYDALPAADLLIVKDVLQHLPNADVATVLGLRQFAIILATNCAEGGSLNEDIPVGAFRPLALRAPPFAAPGEVVFRYELPLGLHLRPRLDLAALARHLLRRRTGRKEVVALHRSESPRDA